MIINDFFNAHVYGGPESGGSANLYRNGRFAPRWTSLYKPDCTITVFFIVPLIEKKCNPTLI